MARVIVTGHDIGLGKIAYEQLLTDGHEVVGVCRPTWDVESEQDREWLVSNYAHFDVLINNAYELNTEKFKEPNRKIGQVELLKLFLEKWEGNNNKFIISHSSKISLKSPQKDMYLKRYSLDKKAHNRVIDEWLSHNPTGPNLCKFMIGWYTGAEEQIYIKQYEPLRNGVRELGTVDPTYYTDWLRLAINNRHLVWLNEVIVDKSDRYVNWLKYRDRR